MAIKEIFVENLGPIECLKWENVGKINLFIGENACGKTFLLKALYVFVRSLEVYARGNERKTFAQVLSDKMYWTYQVKKIGELVRKNALDGKFSLSLVMDEGNGRFSFGKDTETSLKAELDPVDLKREENSVFFPAKEVLSLLSVIKRSREDWQMFGFDDTYYDLAKAVDYPPQKGKNYFTFAQARKILEEKIVHGSVVYDAQAKEWHFKQGRYKYALHQVAEGVKKIGLIDTLLGNRFLQPGSILFVDEPEAALHPGALSRFLEILFLLSKENIQVFMATHSYFVIKKMYVMAKKEKMDVPVLLFEKEENSDNARGYFPQVHNLKEGMPANTIIEEAVRLYEEEIEVE
ncbi:hypothetical protein BREVNS_2102 [Brevinematales bacterium NS]|nr:AAA family ATPase [Brevinematales bacterium]QJR22852.1 hypothetical protein BREVNS_2102 [Brevinematales bacterium NS]